jgi:ATP-dependent RNA helicase SUPV3L1/SUV3
MLERLADLIRPLLAWRGGNGSVPPKGATGDGAFTVVPEMMSLLGCSPDELGGVLKALGFRLDRRPVKPVATPAEAAASNGAEEAAPVDAAALLASAPATPTEPPTAEVIAAAPIEQKFEEVWRPRRHARGERRKDHGHRGRQRGSQPAPTATAPTVEQPTAAGAEVAAAPPAERREHKPMPHKGHAKGGGREHGKDRAERGSDASNQRRGRPGDRPRREERRKAEVHSAAPPRRSGMDPDSPFAALGALRDELVKRGKETST